MKIEDGKIKPIAYVRITEENLLCPFCPSPASATTEQHERLMICRCTEGGVGCLKAENYLLVFEFKNTIKKEKIV